MPFHCSPNRSANDTKPGDVPAGTATASTGPRGADEIKRFGQLFDETAGAADGAGIAPRPIGLSNISTGSGGGAAGGAASGTAGGAASGGAACMSGGMGVTGSAGWTRPFTGGTRTAVVVVVAGGSKHCAEAGAQA